MRHSQWLYLSVILSYRQIKGACTWLSIDYTSSLFNNRRSFYPTQAYWASALRPSSPSEVFFFFFFFFVAVTASLSCCQVWRWTGFVLFVFWCRLMENTPPPPFPPVPAPTPPLHFLPNHRAQTEQGYIVGDRLKPRNSISPGFRIFTLLSI